MRLIILRRHRNPQSLRSRVIKIHRTRRFRSNTTARIRNQAVAYHSSTQTQLRRKSRPCPSLRCFDMSTTISCRAFPITTNRPIPICIAASAVFSITNHPSKRHSSHWPRAGIGYITVVSFGAHACASISVQCATSSFSSGKAYP